MKTLQKILMFLNNTILQCKKVLSSALTLIECNLTLSYTFNKHMEKSHLISHQLVLKWENIEATTTTKSTARYT